MRVNIDDITLTICITVVLTSFILIIPKGCAIEKERASRRYEMYENVCKDTPDKCSTIIAIGAGRNL